ncbi:MAG: cytochrome c biogenesis protein ResB [Gammaproteobacteria bacterium]|nr:cytochrome c biogenesis protein ResB [Gammaproteobacteria bacterium]
MVAASKTKRNQHSTSRRLLEFFGSMNLAITLLVVIAIASVIGTVLQQNQPYNDYIIKFGPFWFEVFDKLQLYDVYHALWFLVILAFLVISTSTCIYRNTPTMLREMRQWREHISRKSLAAFHLKAEWQIPSNTVVPIEGLEQALTNRGYKVKRHVQDTTTTLAAKRGVYNRIGYILTHAAIVVICIGGLLDGNIPIMLSERLGNIQVETRDVSVSKMDKKSFLPVENPSYRGNITIPENQAASFIFLSVRDGVLVQHLPFTVEVKDFRITHYDNGQPKSYESDLVIYDDDLDQPIEQTISVNHPLIHKGITIYQASFGDGGSKLKLRAWPLGASQNKSFTLQGTVKRNTDITIGDEKIVLEIGDFRKFNIHNLAQEAGAKDFKNVGPSFQFKLRRSDGDALEYNNYMSPIKVEGRLFMLSGVRSTPGEAFNYIHLPVGPDGSLKRFLRFLELVHSDAAMLKVAKGIADITLSVASNKDPKVRQQIIDRTVELGRLFARGGFAAIEKAVDRSFAKEKRMEGFRAYMNIIRVQLAALFERTLREAGEYKNDQLTPRQEQFYEDAVTVLTALPHYGSPIYLQLTDFEHIEATGLEITRSPGKYIVYLGCTLLLVGVFMLFYIHPRRVWVMVTKTGQGATVLCGGSDHRKSPDFEREFGIIRLALSARLKPLV